MNSELVKFQLQGVFMYSSTLKLVPLFAQNILLLMQLSSVSKIGYIKKKKKKFQKIDFYLLPKISFILQ